MRAGGGRETGNQFGVALLFVNYCLKALLRSGFNVSVYLTVLRGTPARPLSQPNLARSPAALSALDIEGTSSTAHEEETDWSLQAARVSPPSTRAPECIATLR